MAPWAGALWREEAKSQDLGSILGPMSPKKTEAIFGRCPFLYLVLHREMKRREERREETREEKRERERKRGLEVRRGTGDRDDE